MQTNIKQTHIKQNYGQFDQAGSTDEPEGFSSKVLPDLLLDSVKT